MKYPETYLHVRYNKSGQEWIMSLRGNSRLNLKTQIKNWVKKEYFTENI